MNLRKRKVINARDTRKSAFLDTRKSACSVTHALARFIVFPTSFPRNKSINLVCPKVPFSTCCTYLSCSPRSAHAKELSLHCAPSVISSACTHHTPRNRACHIMTSTVKFDSFFSHGHSKRIDVLTSTLRPLKKQTDTPIVFTFTRAALRASKSGRRTWPPRCRPPAPDMLTRSHGAALGRKPCTWLSCARVAASTAMQLASCIVRVKWCWIAQ